MLHMIINLEKNLKLPFDFDYLIFSELVSIYFQKKWVLGKKLIEGLRFRSLQW